MSKIVIADAASGINIQAINDNFAAIAAELNDKVLYRENPVGEPNQMLNDLDMNSHRILNLPAPIAMNEPARKQDLVDIVAGGGISVTAADVSFVPGGNLTATDVQAAVLQANDNTTILRNETNASLASLQTSVTANTSAISTNATAITGRAITVSTITALRSVDKTKATSAVVSGYYTKNDGFGGLFFLDSTDTTSADNGGSVIVATDGGRWKRPIPADGWNIGHFGAKGDNTFDNYQAIMNTIAASTPGKVVIHVPTGVFYVSTQLTYFYPTSPAYSKFKMIGQGSTATELQFAGTTNGMTVVHKSNFDSTHIEGMTWTTRSVGNIGLLLQLDTGLGALQDSNSAIKDMCFRGSDGYVKTNRWDHCLYVLGVCNINFDSCTFSGTTVADKSGVTLLQNGPSQLPVVFNFINCQFNYLGSALVYGAGVQGVTCSGCNFTGCLYGIYVPPGEVGLDQLSVVNCQFNNFNGNIYILSPLEALSVTGNFFLIQPGAHALYLDNYAEFTFVGNVCNPAVTPVSNMYGVVAYAWQSGQGIITGNNFHNITTGVILNTASKRINVQSNVYGASTAMVANNGTGNTVGGGSY